MMKKTYKKILAAGLSTVMAAGAALPFNTVHAQADSPNFSDVNQSNYFAEAVINLSQKGVIKGFADGTFRPNEEISRAQAAVILASALELDVTEVKDPGFNDVPSGVWYYGAVAALKDAGIMNGKDSNQFLPNKAVTRAEMAKMLSLAYELKSTGIKTNFTDVDAKSWFAGYVEAIAENNITSGVSSTSFAPGQAVTRGQMAAFTYRAENHKAAEEIDVPEEVVTVPPSQNNGSSTPPGDSTPPSQDTGGSTAPAEGPAAELSILTGLGFTYGSTAIFFETAKVNPTYYKLSSQSIAVPNTGGALPEGVTPFTKTAEIKNAQEGQYVQVYEADANGKILAFHQYQIAKLDIKDFNHYRFVYDKTTASNTVKIKFNAKLSAETLANTQISEIIDVLQITNEGTMNDFNKSDIESLQWDTTAEDNPLLVMNFKSPVTFAASHKLQAELQDTVRYLVDTGRDAGDFSFIPSASEKLRAEHLVRLAFSPDSEKTAYHVSNYLSELVYNKTITNVIYENKENYLNEIKKNADVVNDYASLQSVIDEANKLPYLKRAYVYFSSNGQNKLRLEFSEDVWLDQLTSGTDFVITVPESDIKTRNITAYTNDTAETKSSIVYLTFDGPAIPHDGYAEVFITPSGGAKIKDIDQNGLPSVTIGGIYPGF